MNKFFYFDNGSHSSLFFSNLINQDQRVTFGFQEMVLEKKTENEFYDLLNHDFI